MTLKQKEKRLHNIVHEMGSLVVAFSGGVDSALVLKAAYMCLGARVLAVTADSPSVARAELQIAREIARDIGARHTVIETHEMENANYASNPVNRCYFCKSELYSRLLEVARQENIAYIANGTNLDDVQDYRPGLQAADEFRVVSPLKQAGLTKQDVRDLARKWGLRVWDKPATPCLSSRVPYGSAVTRQKLSMIEQAESYLKQLNIRELRVRHFGESARIEVNRGDFQLLADNLDKIERRFRDIGFASTQVAEFRSGALNHDVANHKRKSETGDQEPGTLNSGTRQPCNS